MNKKKNLSFLLLGSVSILFIFTLIFFSQSNADEPVTASADLSAEESNNQNHDSDNAATRNGNSLITNNIDNTIDSNTNEVEVHNNVENQIESQQADIDNSLDNTITSNGSLVNNSIDNLVDAEDGEVENSINNNVNSGENNTIDNSITNHIDVNFDVNVTNNITNDITRTKGEGTDNDGDEADQGEAVNEDNGNGSEETPETVWGVDSASLTTEDLLACVRENFGEPEVWGRYLGTNEGVSFGLTAEEIDLLHSNDIQILIIWNHFTDGTGYENGKNEAVAAVETARDLGIPEGIALFANVEPIYPIDSAFIQAWHNVISDSEYSSGIYGIFDPSEELYAAFEAAAVEDASILDEMYVWTAAPNVGIATEANAPEYNPEYPDGALLGGWQYGIDAEACNIDTNIFDGVVLDVLW